MRQIPHHESSGKAKRQDRDSNDHRTGNYDDDVNWFARPMFPQDISWAASGPDAYSAAMLAIQELPKRSDYEIKWPMPHKRDWTYDRNRDLGDRSMSILTREILKQVRELANTMTLINGKIIPEISHLDVFDLWLTQEPKQQNIISSDGQVTRQGDSLFAMRRNGKDRILLGERKGGAIHLLHEKHYTSIRPALLVSELRLYVEQKGWVAKDDIDLFSMKYTTWRDGVAEEKALEEKRRANEIASINTIPNTDGTTTLRVSYRDGRVTRYEGYEPISTKTFTEPTLNDKASTQRIELTFRATSQATVKIKP